MAVKALLLATGVGLVLIRLFAEGPLAMLGAVIGGAVLLIAIVHALRSGWMFLL